ncbi:glycoside hydrolase family 23 protein [Botryobasidium botryosum FD-172 SS1]|uniref:Glycoside hydrolase family 23 protein n=1 Tax=Botryobasidium botryosum (strain FD-172 SS1) TaxID=930990 RepID=A0A067NBD1_BOTB1|nr:glycoside hydrolase family 23 protein [Botryobasidium botryosum FD-172 SS1]
MHFLRAVLATFFSTGFLFTSADAFLSLGVWNRNPRPYNLSLVPRSGISPRSSHHKQCRLVLGSNNSQGAPQGPSQGPSPSQPTHAPQPQPTQTGPSNGVIHVASPGACAGIGATINVTTTTGPNGAIDWLNCGVDSDGWNPAYVTVDDIVTKDLATVLAQDNSAFAPCAPYLDLFNKYSKQYGIPTILIASFAMQESTCNPSTIGGAGEQGMMQITPDKCTGAPKGNCLDPDFNIRTGVHYFADTLKSNGGNVLLAVGQYNGWYQGLTYASATAAQNTSCCHCQNNLDYVHQFFNGWCQGVNAFDAHMGKYFNVNVCGS